MAPSPGTATPAASRQRATCRHGQCGFHPQGSSRPTSRSCDPDATLRPGRRGVPSRSPTARDRAGPSTWPARAAPRSRPTTRRRRSRPAGQSSAILLSPKVPPGSQERCGFSTVIVPAREASFADTRRTQPLLSGGSRLSATGRGHSGPAPSRQLAYADAFRGPEMLATRRLLDGSAVHPVNSGGEPDPLATRQRGSGDLGPTSLR